MAIRAGMTWSNRWARSASASGKQVGSVSAAGPEPGAVWTVRSNHSPSGVAATLASTVAARDVG
ncbi:hypothetical protein [Actinomadura vinacea]|uniref:hypothetical protein n=1 Tax=Actinomadura vinacea TaxID=115336 RepID=UPI0031DDF565